jgi:(p)ppGpp synthase/HD superfamily hydrolase
MHEVLTGSERQQKSASLLRVAGYRDHVVASGVLHDVLENTDTDATELEDRFGPRVSGLVQARGVSG